MKRERERERKWNEVKNEKYQSRGSRSHWEEFEQMKAKRVLQAVNGTTPNQAVATSV